MPPKSHAALGKNLGSSHNSNTSQGSASSKQGGSADTFLKYVVPEKVPAAQLPADGKWVQQSFRFAGDDPGFTWSEGAVVQSVAENTQAEKHGIQPGWRIYAVGDDLVKARLDTPQAKLGKRVANSMRMKSTYHQEFGVSFLVATKPLDLEKVQKQEDVLQHLDDMSSEEREKNLDNLELMNTLERGELLQRPKAVHGLLRGGRDELAVLFKDMKAQQIRKCHDLWRSLRSSQDLHDVEDVDMSYADSNGDTPLHMARTPSSLRRLMQAASRRSQGLPGRPNKDGIRPLEAMLRREKSAKDRRQLLGVWANETPSELRSNLSDGTPMLLVLEKEERELMPPPPVPWPDVRAVLLAEDITTFQRGYAALSQRLRDVQTELDPSDRAAIWSGLLSEHCFGSLDVGDGNGASGTSETSALHHNATSRERLNVVWNAISLVLRHASDPTKPLEKNVVDESTNKPILHTDVKGIGRGLLSATMGPKRPPFDPREPYRELLVALVYELQNMSASRVNQILQESKEKDSEGTESLSMILAQGLHGVDTRTAEARGAPPRLRLDAALSEPVKHMCPIPIPEWVLQQQLNVEMVNVLKTAGCVEKAADIVDLCASKIEGLSTERMRFANLHTAWVWTFCGRQLAALNDKVCQVLGFPSEQAAFPCTGVDGLMMHSFRARSTPKGLPRLLEKTGDALQEELAVGTAHQLLKTGPNVEEDDTDNLEQRALRELFTPACYVCDINGAEVSMGSMSDMVALYRRLRGLRLEVDGCMVVRTKNGFSNDAELNTGGYKDLKVWLLVNDEGTPAMTELQIHLRRLHELKPFMHMSYECYRGSYDHPHLVGLWQHVPAPKPPPDCDLPTLPAPPKRGCCAALASVFRCGRSGSAKVAVEA